MIGACVGHAGAVATGGGLRTGDDGCATGGGFSAQETVDTDADQFVNRQLTRGGEFAQFCCLFRGELGLSPDHVITIFQVVIPSWHFR